MKTKTTTHTPGPWTYEPLSNEAFAILGPGRAYVGQVDAEDGDGLNEDDARLIAAAPDLLNVCRMAAENIEEGYPHDASVILENLRAAIAKATGGVS